MRNKSVKYEINYDDWTLNIIFFINFFCTFICFLEQAWFKLIRCMINNLKHNVKKRREEKHVFPLLEE